MLLSCQELGSVRHHGRGNSWREDQRFMLLPKLQTRKQHKREENNSLNFKLGNKWDVHALHLPKSHRNTVFHDASAPHKETLVNIVKQSFIHAQ